MTHVSITPEGRLGVPDSGPLDLLTPAALEALQKTPAVFGGDNTLVQVFPRLTEDSRRFIWESRKTNDRLNSFLLDLEFHYASISNPELGGVWPTLRRGDILDEIFVDCPPLASLKTLINGQRFAFTFSDGMRYRLSFREFEDYYQMTVADHLRRTAAVKISRLQRALDLVSSNTPSIYDIGVYDGDNCGRRDVVAYNEDQIKRYANSNKLHLLEMHSYDAEFKDGRFVRQGS